MDCLAEPAARKALELVCDLDNAIPDIMRGDSGRVRQILLNLCGNAVKFTENGEICVSARAVSHTPDKTRVRIEIRDTGVGIP